MLLLLLLSFHFPVFSMEKVPNDVFYAYIILQLADEKEPLMSWSEVAKGKKYNQDQCDEFWPAYRDRYIKKIDDLSSNSWRDNFLDVISLALVNKQCCNRVLSSGVLDFRTQLCLCFKELNVGPDQMGVVKRGFSPFLTRRPDRSLCKSNCYVDTNSIMLQYFFQYDQTNNIHLLIATTFGHGSCLENSQRLFITEDKNSFNCAAFGDYLLNMGDRLLEVDKIKKLVKLVGFYIGKQPSLPVGIVSYINSENAKHQNCITKNELYTSATKTIAEGKVTVGINVTMPGIRYILIPCSVSYKTRSVLKLIQLLPMYYRGYQEDIILNLYEKAFPKKIEQTTTKTEQRSCVIC